MWLHSDHSLIIDGDLIPLEMEREVMLFHILLMLLVEIISLHIA